VSTANCTIITGVKSESHRSSGPGGHALVSRELLLALQIQSDPPLDQRIDQQSNDREHR
jgi:hypothetical protein